MKNRYKDSELGYVPSEWEILRLVDVVEVNPKKDVIEDEQEVSFISMEMVSNSGGVIINDTRNYSDVSKGYSSFRNKDILLAKITPCFENGKKALVRNLKNGIGFGSTEFHVLRSKDQKVIPEFVYYYISSHNFRELAKLNMTGSAGQKRVPTSFLNEVKLIVPTIKEQEKITNILFIVDLQIDDIDKLIEKTKELKKGLMQRLLTKGIIGHKEFKKSEVGCIPKSWDVNELIDISLGKGDYGIGAAATEYENGEPRYLRITDIGDSCDLLMTDIKGVNDEKCGDYILKENDIVFARTGNTTGKSYVYNKNDGLLVYAGFLIKFSIDPLKCNTNFLKYIVQSKRYWDWVKVMSTRSGQPGINSAEYSKFKIQIPSINEQNKIVDILSSVDTQIEEYKNKKNKLEELKKGLMQQLLTGKIRVN